MLNDSVTLLRGIGQKKAVILRNEAGIETVEDLLYYIPRRYIDRSYFKLIKDCFLNDIVTVSGRITNVHLSRGRKRFLEVDIDDGTDVLKGVFFGGVQYFMKLFTIGDFVIFSGKINFYRKKQMVHPEFDFVDDSSVLQGIHTGRIIPLYRSTEKLKSYGFDSRGFRRVIKGALDNYLPHVEETVDPAILARHSLVDISTAIYSIHFPGSFEEAERARRRLAFNELFFHQYYLSLSRRYMRETKRKKIAAIDDSACSNFISGLPFKLTSDQSAAVAEIRSDMASPYPMNRMLQGDVGSGKTVVAMAAILMAFSRGSQSALMAPTEILAQQHYANFKKLIGGSVGCLLLTGSTPKSEKLESYRMISEGKAGLVIGTHALIQEGVAYRDLGLIVIDEQHRFGVEQRSALREKGEDTDLLIMTATPIPRSLSLTIYGDLAVTSIRTMPLNRLPVKTMAFQESRLQGVYNSMERYISQGRQVYYVLPIIEESEKIDLKSATQVFNKLKNEVFPDRRVDLLHGRMKQEERDGVMRRFKEGEIDILVCTTVIEVGIDVPNATIIVIEHAERFGLSQLHQLRGRVGRGDVQSFCILVSPDDVPDDSRRRIETIVATNDGFAIAEEDLKQRGAGELIGFRQHGHGGSFEFADLSLDMELILYARDVAEQLVSGRNDVAVLWDQFKNKKYGPLLNGIRNKKILNMLS
ncbi:MAG: ATP-dependent DNA helicase RecG [Spirochaetes bacterium]|nr:ATP-dependent DNA helicase RecG [Spirochaetota bacterium]